MYQFWKKKTQEEIKEVIFGALKKNVDFEQSNVLGVPASYLDNKVFSPDDAIFAEAPFIATLIHNPNHIGCHTLVHSESYFAGTQAIERELIEICAVDIFKGKPAEQDGYVASGGTEANIQAAWIYRNYYRAACHACDDQIAILASEDSHYSVDKAANLLGLDIVKVAVHPADRAITPATIEAALQSPAAQGKRYWIVYANMMTTMFGSVDHVEYYADALQQRQMLFKIHIDGAFGGFYYPFTAEQSPLTFQNPHISSFTIDAHKMAQAPYGTGIFLIRKGYMGYTETLSASYVKGNDCTLIGSRSGANAVAAWMILVKNGPFGWQEKIFILQKRTKWMCNRLQEIGIAFYRHPQSNIIAIRKDHLSPAIAARYGLVPDHHLHPQWYKIVIMDHVFVEKLMGLLDALQPPTTQAQPE